MTSLMARSKQEYIINIHYPETEEGLLKLRKRMGSSYINFIKDYIMTLPISGEEKNKLYFEINARLQKRY